MTITLTTLTSRVRFLLGDSPSLKWSDADIAMGLGQALGEASLAAGQVLAVAGLEGAPSTTLPETLAAALVTGAAGFCATARAGARVDWESQSQDEPERLARWGEQRLSEFRTQLEWVYQDEARVHDQRASETPWASWPDDFGEKKR